MELDKLDRYFRELLNIEELENTDYAINGLQVSRSKQEIKKAAFAVDACMESFKRAADWKADILFVHHGLFWGKPVPLTGGLYKRIKYLIDNDLALYAAHLPLDMNPDFGNNAGIVKKLKLKDIEPFGVYKGEKIGFKGKLSIGMSIDEVLEVFNLDRHSCLKVLPFGQEKIFTVGVVSGGATEEVVQAISEDLDLFITGDASHQIYHQCLEHGINMISAGHYNTEVWGVKLLSEKLSKETGLETSFIDVPTGL